MISLQKLESVVYQSMSKANDEISLITLSENQQRKVAKSMLMDITAFSELQVGAAVQVWASILFVDMRKSTARAEELGAAKTYVTMHGLLAALAYIASEDDGYIVGFRGDGLFVAFGIDANGREITGSNRGNFVGQACSTGLTMVAAVQEVVNPALRTFNIPGDVKIGAGIDAGSVIITKVGLQQCFELTAYGNAVNRAAKLCGQGHDEVIVSTTGFGEIPSSPDGKLSLVQVNYGDLSGYRVTQSGPLLMNSPATKNLR